MAVGNWQLRRMDFKDYYATLGVNKSSTEKEIKQTFRKLARKHHPDVNPGDKAAESRFKEINEAYEVLGDPAKRKKYDELGANWRAYEQAGAAQGGRPFDPSQFGGGWNTNYGGGGPGGGTARRSRRGGRARRASPSRCRTTVSIRTTAGSTSSTARWIRGPARLPCAPPSRTRRACSSRGGRRTASTGGWCCSWGSR